jgi:hypothetical protein
MSQARWEDAIVKTHHAFFSDNAGKHLHDSPLASARLHLRVQWCCNCAGME